MLIVWACIDFSASEGHGYRSSTDADGQSQLIRSASNGNGFRSARPPSSFPHPVPPVPEHVNNNGNGGNGNGGNGYGADRPDEDFHAYSTVGDASISLYPSSGDHHDMVPPPFVGGFSPVPEKEREEYTIPERGYSSGYVIPGSAGSGDSGGNGSGGQNSPGVGEDPFAANRRPTAFSRVFGDRQAASGAGAGTGRGSAGNSPTTATGGRGGSPVVGRAGASPILTRGGAPSTSPILARGRGVGGPHNMGFGRQQAAMIPPRDSAGFSEGSSSTAVGLPGDVASSRDDGSPIPTGPFAGRSGYGARR